MNTGFPTREGAGRRLQGVAKFGHSGRPEHLLSKEALVKQATSLRGLCEAHVHLGLGEE